ncbi:MAG: RICIN domain-containing protein [Lachnospiraceae bacterium]|nr:RICIN domain-containing protein [Lachnospiraceae bacterium]
MVKKILALCASFILLFSGTIPVSAAHLSEENAIQTELESGLNSIAESALPEEAAAEAPDEGAEENPGAAESVVPAADAGTLPAVSEESALESASEALSEQAEDPAAESAAESQTEQTEDSAAESGPQTEQAENAVSEEASAEPAEAAAEEPAAEADAAEEETLEVSESSELVGAAAFEKADAEDGKLYFIHSAKNPDYVLDVAGAGYNNGTKLQLYAKNATNAQKFMFIETASDTYVLYNLMNGKAVDVKGGSRNKGTQIQMYEPNGTAAQSWKFVKNANGTYTLVSGLESSKVLDISGGIMANKRKVQLYTSNATPAQQFYLEEASMESQEAVVMLRPLSNQALAATPAGYSSGHTNLMADEAAAGSSYQHFSIEDAGYGLYRIVNQATGKVIDVSGARKTAGNNIQLYTWNGTNAQLWRVQKNSDGSISCFSRLNSGLMLTLNGTNFETGSRALNENQKFVTTDPENESSSSQPVEAASEIKAWIESASDSDRVLGMSSDNLVSADLTLEDSQKLTIEPIHVDGVPDGYYVRLAASNGKVVDVVGGKTVNGQNVRFYQWNGSDAQLWHPLENADGTTSFLNKKDQNMTLDIRNCSKDYGTNIQLYTNKSIDVQKWYLASLRITQALIGSDHNTVTVKASGSIQSSDDGKAYLFAVDPYVSSISGKGPVASGTLSSDLAITASLNKNNAASLLQKKLYVAVKKNGVYRIISNAYYITNPEAAATQTTAFPTSRRATKKGLKLSLNQLSYAKDLKCSHAAIDMPIEVFLNASGDRTSYNYEGNTYTFYNVNGYKSMLKSFKDAGIVVTGIFYLSDKSKTAFMEPEARSGSNLGSAVLLGLNTRDSGRKQVEALFSCLAEAFTKDGILVANWILSNEVDQYIIYNYSGDLGYNLYHESLAEQYRLFNAAIKSRWSNARCYISLDHNWNFTGSQKQSMDYRWYQGMSLVRDFNQDLTRQGRVHWDIAMHPYPSPEQDCRFWLRTYSVLDLGTTPQVTMLNASSWAAYIKNTYGNDTHIIMSETGISSKFPYNGKIHDQTNYHAAAVAFAYYQAEFDGNIDEIDIHRLIEDSGEAAGGFYLGLYETNGRTAKPAAAVFRDMDTKNWNSVTKNYLPYIRISDSGSFLSWYAPSETKGKAAGSWSQIIKGFNGNRWSSLS